MTNSREGIGQRITVGRWIIITRPLWNSNQANPQDRLCNHPSRLSEDHRRDRQELALWVSERASERALFPRLPFPSIIYIPCLVKTLWNHWNTLSLLYMYPLVVTYLLLLYIPSRYKTLLVLTSWTPPHLYLYPHCFPIIQTTRAQSRVHKKVMPMIPLKTGALQR